MKTKLMYCSYSETIRQMPQNYLAAARCDNKWKVGGINTDTMLGGGMYKEYRNTLKISITKLRVLFFRLFHKV